VDHVTGLLYAVAALLAALTGLVAALAKILWQRDAATDTRVDMLRDMLLARGKAKNWQANRYEGDMPLKLKSKFRASYEPIASALRALRKANSNATDGQLAEIIEARYGAWLLTHICQVFGVFDFECFDMAVAVANETDKSL
jgi:hypothetical protein